MASKSIYYPLLPASSVLSHRAPWTAHLPLIHLVLPAPVPLFQSFPHNTSAFRAAQLDCDLTARFPKALPGFSELSASTHISCY